MAPKRNELEQESFLKWNFTKLVISIVVATLANTLMVALFPAPVTSNSTSTDETLIYILG